MLQSSGVLLGQRQQARRELGQAGERVAGAGCVRSLSLRLQQLLPALQEDLEVLQRHAQLPCAKPRPLLLLLLLVMQRSCLVFWLRARHSLLTCCSVLLGLLGLPRCCRG
jgi:hypothetical protein